MRDKHVRQVTALRRHADLCRDVVLVGWMNEARRKEGRRSDGGDVVNRHLVEALKVNDELEETEQLAHCVSVFVRQQQTKHRDGARLVLGRES